MMGRNTTAVQGLAAESGRHEEAAKIGVVQIYKMCYDCAVAVHDTRHGACLCC